MDSASQYFQTNTSIIVMNTCVISSLLPLIQCLQNTINTNVQWLRLVLAKTSATQPPAIYFTLNYCLISLYCFQTQ